MIYFQKYQSTFRSALTMICLGLTLAFACFGILANTPNARSAQIATTEQTNLLASAIEDKTLLLQLKQKLAQVYYRKTLLHSNEERSNEALEEIDKMISNLKTEILRLENQLKDKSKQITSVKSQKEAKKMELQNLESQVAATEERIENQKLLVGELIEMIYIKRNMFYSGDDLNEVVVLASSGSVSETLQDMTYMDLLEEESMSQIEIMSMLSEKLAKDWQAVRSKRKELDSLDMLMSEERSAIENELKLQRDLLLEMEEQRSIYESMRLAAEDSEESIEREIESLELSVEAIENKYKHSKDLLNDEEKELLAQIEAEPLGFQDFDWPVDPEKGLTAFFIDSGYLSAFGVQHHALDIRAAQGSDVRSVASGLVQKVVYDPDSTRYAYILIKHKMGISSVYGHMSATAVKEGDVVEKGQLIGYSGGAVGGIGTGGRSTGPHLHVEFWQDGSPVDPLLYLPIEEVPQEFLPESYIKILQEKLEEHLR